MHTRNDKKETTIGHSSQVPFLNIGYSSDFKLQVQIKKNQASQTKTTSSPLKPNLLPASFLNR